MSNAEEKMMRLVEEEQVEEMVVVQWGEEIKISCLGLGGVYPDWARRNLDAL